MKVGLDVGSTTIKCVVLDDSDNIIYSTYERHMSHVVEKAEELLRRTAAEHVPGGRAVFAISGSAGMGMAESVGVPFVQEVFATRVAANRLVPGTDVVIHANNLGWKNKDLRGELKKHLGAIPIYIAGVCRDEDDILRMDAVVDVVV